MSTATWITVQEAASILKRTDRQIQEYCRSGWLSSKKKKGKLLIAEDSLEVFKLLYEGSREGAFKEETEEVTEEDKIAGMALADELDTDVTDEQVMQSNNPVQPSEATDSPSEAEEDTAKSDDSKSTTEEATSAPPELDASPDKQMGDQQKMSDSAQNGNGHGTDNDNEDYVNMLNTLRERITEHMEAERAFGTEMLNLIDSVQSVMQNVQKKEDKLIQDIVQVVSKYSTEEESK